MLIICRRIDSDRQDRDFARGALRSPFPHTSIMPVRIPFPALPVCRALACALIGVFGGFPAAAQDLSSLFGWAKDGPARGAPVTAGSWKVSILREATAVAARDPAWTPTVSFFKAPLIAANPIPRAAPGVQDPITGRAHALHGIASFYHEDQMTATGERFDRTAMTAAHRTLPLNTVVRVTNEVNGRSVVVRINDRGPYKPGRIIDLSQAAADALGMLTLGLVPVSVRIISN